ncbi:filamentous hemagglutinin N-terminal domain-containing protein [Haemophilus influenzae]|uniref:two-partner secretion domain-containing protein n=3 Tax=Haemophilus influenzae TaxID=727 RepID=UPI002404BA46|nr:filamentous hemagglutinin N-terminal domain-containing protein [Haemophilus influenzae]MCK8855562.1 filamentous hemagglutinin N-terminal domain-containing protein [Haemophilus influenzae]MCK8862735.1 filamentous hemagglutinin N-terminal domain-containing protein [Haemophilus influenzae]MDF9920322.1 filamentous hemagglutinin N-terminal domain-containing protein [Haemophilus influenzae]
MNKIYRLKFSKRLNALVAVSELARGCDHSTEKGSEKPARMKVRHLALKPLSAILLSLGVTSIPQSVLASGLQGMDVVHGTATMQVDGNKTIIRNSVDAIINWKQFNIDQNEMVQFLQENNNSAVFNRVTSNQISQLKGILDSNGQVFLINPNGITIGKDAIINTNGFTASTLDISNENIKARNFTLEQTKDKALAEIVNHGLITVGKDGSVNLIGGKVKNEGVISVNGGSISLLAGQKITISDIINPTITYSIAAPENEAINLGDIFAKGGNINVRAANIRNKGKLSADSVSKDKSGNIVLSAKEGEAEIGGVISAQNQQAKGGKLMITGDKVTLKTGAVIDLSGKEGGETYLGGDERGEGKNGIQLAKKTSLEKGSTINVSGKEKGGRAIVWGDIALIDGNINARGSDITKTGGFVETSGHDLFIKDNAIVDAKEWLLDPDEVSINALALGRTDIPQESSEYTLESASNEPERKKNKLNLDTLTNATLENILKRGTSVNITATRKINVTSAINLSNGSLTLHTERGGIELNGDITSDNNKAGANLTIKSGGWLDIHSNISLGERDNINITAKGDIAFEKGNNQIIKGRGVITSGDQNGFRFDNVSLNGVGTGLLFNTKRSKNGNGNISNHFRGTLNISGIVNISMAAPNTSWLRRVYGRTYWNLTSLNVAENSKFNLTIDNRGSGTAGTLNRRSNLNGITFNGDTTFNVSSGSMVNFDIKASIIVPRSFDVNYALFNGNVSVLGGGRVAFNLDASSNSFETSGVTIKSHFFNVSGGSTLNLSTNGSTKTAFSIENDLTLNATGSSITLKQIEGTDSRIGNGVVANKNITFNGGNITLGSQKAPTQIKGNVTINANTNATLRGANFNNNKSALNITGNVINNGNLTTDGSIINIGGSLTVAESAKLQAVTNFTFNVAGLFDNKGNSNISIAKGGAKFKDINNTKNLSIATNSSAAYRTIIAGNITNKSGDLNITDNKSDAEIEIGGNISQKEGNLTISSDKINITKQITIKKGIVGEGSDSGGADTANLTIKTKELKLTQDLNISGFDKAEIKAKENVNLTIGDNGDGNVNAKTVTFNNVKDSKISANGHNVTLNSKVETSGNTDNTGGSSGNNAGLTINAKNVTVSNDITSHKTVNITASEKLTTKADATINATNGNVKVTTQTGDIKGQVKSTSGSVTIAASGDTLNVSNVSGNAVTITADKGKLTAQAGSTIKATTGEANITSATGTIDGTVSGGTVNVTASSGSLTVGGDAKINATEGAATLTATKGTLTTVKGSNIDANKGTLVINAKDAKLDGEASGNRTEVNATNASGSGSVTAATSSSVNITGDLNTINGLNIISENGRNTVRLRGKEIDVKYIQPGVASVEEVIEAKRVLEKVKDLSDEERETLAKLGVSAVRFVEPNNAITVNTQNEFTTRPSSQVTISEGKACFSSGNGAAVCTNVADDGQP